MATEDVDADVGTYGEEPYLTHHAEVQWYNRALDREVSPYTAWGEAIRIDLPHPWGKAGDEARYHPKAGVILCRRGHAIPTVYDLHGPDAKGPVRRAVEEQLNVDLDAVLAERRADG